MLQRSVVDGRVQCDYILLIHPCLDTLCLCVRASEMWRWTPLPLTSATYWWHLPDISPRDLTRTAGKSVVKCGSSMMAPQHTALILSVSIWMKPLATDGLDVEAQWPGLLALLTWLHWIHMQSLVYETPVETQHDLMARIAVAAGTIREMLGIFQRVQRNITRRCRTCNEVSGRHF
jgi:hypothetical protein